MKLFRVKKTCCYEQPSCKLSSDHTEGYHNHLLQLYLNKLVYHMNHFVFYIQILIEELWEA